MIVVIILLILSLAGFCILSSDDLLHKTNLTWHSWIIVILIISAIVCCLFIYSEWICTESIKDFTKGKYKVEEVVHSDTTYLVKKVKEK